MRIAVINFDRTDIIPASEVKSAYDAVGGEQVMVEIHQDEVDAKVYCFSSDELTDKQLDQLWEAGDLWLSDVEVWEGDSFESIIKKVRKHIRHH